MSYACVDGQQTMACDLRRNQAYLQALSKVITPESIVIDLGAGLGVLGILAAKLGAKRVYLVEPEDIISVTQKIVAANGLSERVHCLQGNIEQVEIPEKVDVIISVFTGNFLLEEDLLPSLFYARDKYLKEGGALIPEAGIMQAAPVFAPDIYRENITCWSEPHLEIDHSPARTYASQSIYYYRQHLAQYPYLAAPADLFSLDFYTATSTHLDTQINYTVSNSGLCHGFAGWFKMKLGDTWLSTAPHKPALHWSSMFLPFDPPIELKVGEEFNFKLQRPPSGDWTWQIKTDKIKQVRSTFLAAPRTLNSIKKVSLDYQPQINDKGKAALYVLSKSDGSLSVADISHYVVKDYPELFPTSEQAKKFVQGLISNFA
jgi:hypothetical protein